MLDNSMVLSNKQQMCLIFEDENSNYDDTAFIEEEIMKYTQMVLDNDPAMTIVEGALLSKAQISSEEIEDIVCLIQELENNFKKVIEFSGKWPFTLVFAAKLLTSYYIGFLIDNSKQNKIEWTIQKDLISSLQNKKA